MNRWRQFAQAQASAHDYHFIDVAEDMRKLPRHEFEKLFRKGGHYTDEGNRYVAELIYSRLSELPELADRFQQ